MLSSMRMSNMNSNCSGFTIASSPASTVTASTFLALFSFAVLRAVLTRSVAILSSCIVHFLVDGRHFVEDLLHFHGLFLVDHLDGEAGVHEDPVVYLRLLEQVQ